MPNDNGVGVDNEQTKAEFGRVMRELKKFAHAIDAREIGKLQRSAMKLTQDAMKAEIKNANETFKVYRNGGLYAEIKPGTLAKSIGIGKSKVNNPRLFSAFWVGPRVKGAFRDPEKGGWFAHFINYGNISSGNYGGKNRGFAERAKGRTKTLVMAKFTNDAKKYIEKEFNSSAR